MRRELFSQPRDAEDRPNARVPLDGRRVTARPCRLDGDIATRRAHVPIKVRRKTREALERERYMRPKLIVNATQLADRPDGEPGDFHL